MAPLPQTLMVDSTSSRCISCYSVRTWWCVQKASMTRWKPCSLPSKSSPLECCYPQQTHLQIATEGSGPQWHAGWGCNNHHSYSHFYTSPTPLQQELLSLLVTSLQQSTCSSWVPWSNCSGLPCHHSLCLPTQHAPETATTCSSRGPTSGQRIWRSLQARRDALCHLCSNGDPHANNPNHDAGVSTSVHSSWCPQLHPHHSSNTPANPARHHRQWAPHHTASGLH